MFVWPTGWERTVVVEEVLYTFGVVVLVRVRTAYSPTALWRFRASTSNSPSGRSGRQLTRTCAILIILTLNKIFEYVEMTIFSRPSGSIPIPRRFGFFA